LPDHVANPKGYQSYAKVKKGKSNTSLEKSKEPGLRLGRKEGRERTRVNNAERGKILGLKSRKKVL